MPDKCVECGEEFTLEDLSHVWMEYDPDDLEEGDEEEVYAGLVCKECLKAAAEAFDTPITHLSPDEEEIG